MIPNSKRILCNAYGQKGLLWLDIDSGENIVHSPYSGRSTFWFAISQNGALIVTTEANLATIWDTNAGAAVATLSGHEKRINAVSIDPGSARVVTASDDRTVRVWDAHTGRLIWLSDKHRHKVRNVVFSSDSSKLLAATGEDQWEDSRGNGIYVWDATLGELLTELRAEEEQAIGPFFDNTFTFFNQGVTRVVTFHKSASGNNPRSQVLWNTERGEHIQRFNKEEMSLEQFSPDGTFLIGIAKDRTSNDNIIAATTLEVVRRHVDLQDLMIHAKRAVPRGLPPQERKAFNLDTIPPRWYVDMGKWPYNTPDWMAWQEARDRGENPEAPSTAQ
jgi:WD40 repeat protein